MICIELIGGLGNQMFVYAFARALQMRTGEEIVLYDFYMKEFQKTQEGKFAIKPLVAQNKAVRRVKREQQGENIFSVTLDPARYLLFRAIKKLWKIKTRPRSMDPRTVFEMERALQPAFNRMGICSLQNGYVPTVRYPWPSKYVCQGYFQSASFWGEYVDKIREELYRPDLIREYNRPLLEKMRMCESVSLHIRLGDYVHDQAARNRHYVCDAKYYVNAVNRAKQILSDPVFFVFTNEYDTVRQLDLFRDIKWELVPEGNSAKICS